MILPPLDARLPVLLARLRAAPTDAQAGLRRHADVIARACGRSLDAVIAELAPRPAATPLDTTAEIDSLAASTIRRLPTQPPQPKSCPASYDGPAINISELIAAELRADPTTTDRGIARKVGCSPTMPGRVRKALGIEAPIRSVHRGYQRYAMRTKETAS